MACVCPVPRSRAHNRGTLPSLATNAMVRPSGEIASEAGSVVAGVVRSTRVSGSTGRLSRARPASQASDAARTAAANGAQNDVHLADLRRAPGSATAGTAEGEAAPLSASARLSKTGT